jgi:hypothetical protein
MAELSKSRAQPRLSREEAEKINADLNTSEKKLCEKRDSLRRRLTVYEGELEELMLREKRRRAGPTAQAHTIGADVMRSWTRLKKAISATKIELDTVERTLDFDRQVMHQEELMKTQYIAARHIRLRKAQYTNTSGWLGASINVDGGMDDIASIEDDILEVGEMMAAVDDMFDGISKANDKAFANIHQSAVGRDGDAEDEQALLEELEQIRLDGPASVHPPAPALAHDGRLDAGDVLDGLPDVTNLPRVGVSTNSGKYLAADFM